MFEEFGGFFTIADDASAAFVPLSAASLIEAFKARVHVVNQALPEALHLHAAERERVVVSVAHQGWMARLLSPMLAARVAQINPGFLWIPNATSFFPLALSPDVMTSADVLRDFTQDVQEQYGVSRRAVEGNAASALNNAAQLMNNQEQQPTIAATASDIMGELQLSEGVVGAGFHRSSCCLIYKLTACSPKGGSLCGDCVLRVRG